MIFLKISLNTDDMLAKMSDTNILYIDDIVGNQPDLCMEVSSIFLWCHRISDVPGLQLSGFGRAGPDFFGPRAGPGFFTSGFGLFFGLFQSIKCTFFWFYAYEIRIFHS